MATQTYESARVFWLTSVASISAPTAANFVAGTEVTAHVPTSGLSVAATTNRASLAMLGQGKVAERIGTQQVSPTLTFVKHTAVGDDIVWVLFTYKTAGYLALAYNVESGVIAAGDRVEVYKCETSEPAMNPAAENELQRFTVEFAVEDWNRKAVVA